LYFLKDITRAINESIPYILRPNPAADLPDEEITAVLDIFLAKLGQEELSGVLSYCVMELHNNAKKANMKRSFFLESGLNIDSPDDYEQGMRSFRKEALENRAPDNRRLEKFGLTAFVEFQIVNGSLRLSVRNNAVPTRQEEKRIAERINRSFGFSSLEEALGSIDESEGAGLGIIIVVLALKKIGLERNAFNIGAANGETTASLIIPASDEWKKRFRMLSGELIDYVKKLPDLPENIRRIREMIADKNTALPEIGKLISSDPAMSAETLKLANSAAYGARTKTADIAEAVKRIGLRGLNLIILAYGVQRVLGAKTDFIRGLWEKAYRTANLSRAAAKTMLKKKAVSDDAYAGGLLIDIGTVILSAVHDDAERKIRAFCDRKGIPPVVFEELAAGVNNSAVGALAAEKWGFPPVLIETIRHRHDPESAAEPFRDVAEAVYIADRMGILLEARECAFNHQDTSVFSRFGLSDEAALRSTYERLLAETAEQQ
jgi:HD-like signal output (HDOD) protein